MWLARTSTWRATKIWERSCCACVSTATRSHIGSRRAGLRDYGSAPFRARPGCKNFTADALLRRLGCPREPRSTSEGRRRSAPTRGHEAVPSARASLVEPCSVELTTRMCSGCPALAAQPYGPYTSIMPKKSYGAEEARTLLPELIERAHRGERSVITKRGKPYAEVVPVGSNTNGKPRLSFLSLAGTGHGLWGRDSRKTLRRMRDGW